MTYRFKTVKFQTKAQCLAGEQPIEEVYRDSMRQATREMARMTSEGPYYVAVYAGDTGECCMETVGEDEC